MPARPFLDTNILLYAVGDDPLKSPVAEALLIAGGVTSVQTLNEFTNVGRRKLHLSWGQVEEHVAKIKGLVAEILPITISTHEMARMIAEYHKTQFYDALLLAAALEARCTAFISEDLQDGRLIDGMRITNPFVANPV